MPFGQVRVASQTILDYTDREYDYTYVEENKDENGNVSTERIVGVESIIPQIYKAYRENYKIVFNGIEDNGVFGERQDDGTYKPVNYIDLQKETLGTETEKEKFLLAILYGNKCKEDNVGFDFSDFKNLLKKTNRVDLYDKGIYDKIKDKKFKENVGVYYQEEVGEDGTSASTSDVPDANKTKKRVITYTQLN